MKELLELLRVQRHNFANHLQVISGLLQLKKYDRTGEYIKLVVNEFGEAGTVIRLEVPEIVYKILMADLAAGKQGITIKKAISTSLDKGIEDGFHTAEILGEMLDIALRSLQDSNFAVKGQVSLGIHETPESYVFQVEFLCPEGEVGLAITSSGVFLREEACKIKGDLSVNITPDSEVVFSLKVPQLI